LITFELYLTYSEQSPHKTASVWDRFSRAVTRTVGGGTGTDSKIKHLADSVPNLAGAMKFNDFNNLARDGLGQFRQNRGADGTG